MGRRETRHGRKSGGGGGGGWKTVESTHVHDRTRIHTCNDESKNNSKNMHAFTTSDKQKPIALTSTTPLSPPVSRLLPPPPPPLPPLPTVLTAPAPAPAVAAAAAAASCSGMMNKEDTPWRTRRGRRPVYCPRVIPSSWNTWVCLATRPRLEPPLLRTAARGAAVSGAVYRQGQTGKKRKKEDKVFEGNGWPSFITPHHHHHPIPSHQITSQR